MPTSPSDPLTANPAPARTETCHIIYIEHDGSIGEYYVRQHDYCKCVNRGGNYPSVVVSGHGVHVTWDVNERYPVPFHPNCYTLTSSQPSTELESGGKVGTNGKLHVSAPPQQPPAK